jgi:hypothetical protein
MYYSEPDFRELDELKSYFVRSLLEKNALLTEGTVMSMGPPPYRRVDCIGRAVVYFRTRPRKQVVRADVSGLWVICPKAVVRCANIIVRSATGSASLVVKSVAQAELAVDLISESVKYTLGLGGNLSDRGTIYECAQEGRLIR